MKILGWLIGVGIIALIAFVAPVYAVSDSGFTLNIIHNDKPLREIDGRVTMPFGEEYEILLQNENNKRCVAKVFVDGTLVSALGDFVIKKELKLERFVTESLKEGLGFKFVPLDDKNVQDPTNPQNGLIRIEFRLEKRKESEWYIIPKEEFKEYKLPYWWKIENVIVYPNQNILTHSDCATIRLKTIPCSMTLPGATVEGKIIEQKFHKVNLEIEEAFIVLELRIVGVEK